MQSSETRRTFLSRLSRGIAGVICLMVGIPLVGYTVLPALKRREPRWSNIGPIAALEPGVPKELDIVISVTDGWQKTTTKRSVWAFKEDGGRITVYSPICPHLGCG